MKPSSFILPLLLGCAIIGIDAMMVYSALQLEGIDYILLGAISATFLMVGVFWLHWSLQAYQAYSAFYAERPLDDLEDLLKGVDEV